MRIYFDISDNFPINGIVLRPVSLFNISTLIASSSLEVGGFSLDFLLITESWSTFSLATASIRCLNDLVGVSPVGIVIPLLYTFDFVGGVRSGRFDGVTVNLDEINGSEVSDKTGEGDTSLSCFEIVVLFSTDCLFDCLVP